VTKSPTILPLMISFLVLTAVTILQRSSRLAAALTATMPLTIPLALWIVTAGDPDEPQAMTEFTRGLLWSIWPTVLFVIVIWVASRAGWRLAPTIGAGYLAWGLGVALILGARRVIGG
jgi:hypothetical protein